MCWFLVCGAMVYGQLFVKMTDAVPALDGGDSRSVNWADVDGDGDLDLFVTNGHSPPQNNFLYVNNGDGRFTKVKKGPLVEDQGRSDGASFADLDNDGDLDLFVANWYGDDNLLFFGSASGFHRVRRAELATIGGFSESCSWGDFDADGDLDLFIANSGNAEPTANLLFENHGMGIFRRITESAIVTTRAASRLGTWIDYDSDGDLDLFVVNENGQVNELFRNQLIPTGVATFVAVDQSALGIGETSSISASWGDYDNDGDFDVFIANLESANQLFSNHQGTFTLVDDVVSKEGGHSFGSSWGDVDNDGDLDLFVSNGWGQTEQSNFLYLNRLMESGTASFQKVTDDPVVNDGGWSYGSSFADYDEDGDLDLFVAKWFLSQDENNALFQNQGNANHWIQIDCRGTTSNRSAIGAIVRVESVTADGPQRLTRQISGQDSYCGQNMRLHFGLGQASAIRAIQVDWPSGQQQRIEEPARNQVLLVIEP